MRTERDLQLAHDVLHAYVSREIDVGQTDCQVAAANNLLVVLCWLLEHEGGERFQRTLNALMARIQDAGYRLSSSPMAIPSHQRGEG